MTSIAEKPKSRNPSPSPASATSSGVGTTTVNNSSSSPNRPSSATSAMASSQRLTHQSSTGSLFGNIRSTRDRDIMNLVPSAAECSYAACFCEENVWKLCDHVRTTAPNELSKAFVVFVSNKKQVVPLWRQRAGRDEEKLVIWDYHVILIYKPDERCLVFDLDSDLPFPTYFHKYVTETFRTDAILNPEYHRFFRVIPATLFLQTFASDRRHMKKPDGSWMKPPPPYPCIMPPRNILNFPAMIFANRGSLVEGPPEASKMSRSGHFETFSGHLQHTGYSNLKFLKSSLEKSSYSSNSKIYTFCIEIIWLFFNESTENVMATQNL